jgi:hypothetical protein
MSRIAFLVYIDWSPVSTLVALDLYILKSYPRSLVQSHLSLGDSQRILRRLSGAPSLIGLKCELLDGILDTVVDTVRTLGKAFAAAALEEDASALQAEELAINCATLINLSV